MTITLKGGGLFDGILSTGWWDEAGCPEDAKGKQAGVVMKVVRQVVGPEELVAEAVARRVFKRTDMVSLVIKDADLYNDERTVVARSIGDGVLADTEIEVAGRGAGEDRELVRATTWLSEETALDADLSMSKGGSTRNWDQFAVNERLGHRSNYSDDLYTTKLTMDKYTPEQLAKAQAMAAEIEKKGSTNKHVLEERGLKELDDNDDEDEEAKYSMVLTSDGTDPTRAAVVTALATPALPAAPPAAAGSLSVHAPAAGGEDPSKPPLSMKSKLNAAAKAFVPGKPYGGAGAGTQGISGAMSGADAALSPRLPPPLHMVPYGVASPPQMMAYMVPPQMQMAMLPPGAMSGAFSMMSKQQAQQAPQQQQMMVQQQQAMAVQAQQQMMMQQHQQQPQQQQQAQQQQRMAMAMMPQQPGAPGMMMPGAAQASQMGYMPISSPQMQPGGMQMQPGRPLPMGQPPQVMAYAPMRPM